MLGYWPKPNGVEPAGVGSADLVPNRVRRVGMLVNGSGIGAQVTGI